MLTADTITDEQIRRLRDDLLEESLNQMTSDTDACGMALWDIRSYPGHLQGTVSIMRDIGRARCAEILSARGDGPMRETPPIAFGHRPPMAEKHPSMDDWDRAQRRATRQAPRCSYCGDPGHRITDCGKWLKDSANTEGR